MSTTLDGPLHQEPRVSTSTAHSLDLPSLQPLSHDHPLLAASTFSADTFLLSRIHIPLEELRAELRLYLSVLREELVQLINDDYEEFISLGTGLRGEGERLRRLEKPLKGLGDEVGRVRDILVEHQEKVQGKLDERAALREEKSLLDLLQRLFETLTRAEKLLDESEIDERGKMVQRVAGEYAQLVYLLGKAKAEECQIVDTVTPRINGIRSRLSDELSSILLESISNLSNTRLRHVLKMYELIEGWGEAEAVIRNHFKGFCKATITSSSLVIQPSPMVPNTPATPHHSSGQFSNPGKSDRLSDSTPLADLYNRILSQVESYQPLMSIAEEVSERFDIFAGVIWPEIAQSISEELGNVIFSAGRPDDLHKHYTTAHEFIALLETLAPSPSAVTALRSSPSYGQFERRWQLPVYFQLRWKEIVSSFETALNGSTNPSGEWALAQSAATWQALSSCWDPNVYLSELANRFWRLSLQFTVRYGSWLRTQVTASGEDDSAEEHGLKIAAAAVMDLDLLSKKTEGITLIRENGLQRHLMIPTAVFSDKIIEILTRRCSDSLKLVRSVASQFRASPSRNAEITPSYFIPSILKPLHTFYASRPGLSKTYGTDWSARIVDAVCGSYAGILAGVRKTEDLLRRHRKSKKGGLSLFGSGNAAVEDGGEEERFRKQMERDIAALKTDAKGLGVDVEDLPGWKELVDVVHRPAE